LISARQSTLQIRLGSDCVSHRTQPAARAFHSARIFCAPTCAYVLLSTRFALTGHEVRWLPAIRPVRHLSVVICRMTGPIVRPSVPSRLASQSAWDNDESGGAANRKRRGETSRDQGKKL